MNAGKTVDLRCVAWESVEGDLTEHGYARVPGVLKENQCRELASSFDDEDVFRTRVIMERHSFGQGEYGYFREPFPPLVESIREALYPRLAPIANRMTENMRSAIRYPPDLAAFRRRCRAAGQSQPTALLLRYVARGYNRLHRDLYGDVVFPLQATILLSDPDSDFEGGEFLLVENAPRRQARGEAVALKRGEMILFPSSDRPIRGSRGHYRAQIRHGVSLVISGTRLALGIIFHDAK